MTNDLIPLTETTLSLAMAYVLHSTVLLIGVAATLRVLRPGSHTLRERLWKLAVVVPLVTAPAQVWSGAAPIPSGWQFAVATTESVPLETETADLDAATSDEMTKVDPPGESALSASTALAENTVGQTSVSAPLGEEVGRSPDEGFSPTSIGHQSAVSTTSPPTLRAPAAPRREGTATPVAIANPASKIGTPTSPGALSEAGTRSERPPFASLDSATERTGEAASSLTESVKPRGPLVSPEAELAPAMPLPSTSTTPPRTGQGDWPPNPVKPPRAEVSATGAASIENSSKVPHTSPDNSKTTTMVSPAAFGVAVAILASVLGGLLLLVVKRVRIWARLRK